MRASGRTPFFAELNKFWVVFNFHRRQRQPSIRGKAMRNDGRQTKNESLSVKAHAALLAVPATTTLPSTAMLGIKEIHSARQDGRAHSRMNDVTLPNSPPAENPCTRVPDQQQHRRKNADGA